VNQIKLKLSDCNSCFWRPPGSFKVCPDLSACLCAFLLQISTRYNLFHWKISWIRWHNVCLNKELGGLGVRQLKEFNQALLGKWCWRMLVDRSGLWYRVLIACYGEVGGRLGAGVVLLGGGRWRGLGMVAVLLVETSLGSVCRRS